MKFFASKKQVKIKLDYNNFYVYEIDSKGRLVNENYKSYNGDEFLYILKKINWATDVVINKISRMNGVRFKDIGFAGMKDKRATTYQLISSKVKLIKFPKGAELIEAGVGERIKMGDLYGNRFEIVCDCTEELKQGLSETQGKFLNYFGIQRFGKQNINLKVGLALLKGKYSEALDYYLYTQREDKDFREKREFPKYTKHERIIINYRAKYDDIRVWKLLPRNFSLMFIHSVQSFIFNKEVDMRYDQNDLVESTNLIGWSLTPNKYQKEIMDELEIDANMFKMKELKFLNAKGSQRFIFEQLIEPKIQDKKISFSLKSGSYATVAIDQLLGYNYLNPSL